MDFVWMIIVVVLMAVLPDLLRRKRKYPRSKGPIPVSYTHLTLPTKA